MTSGRNMTMTTLRKQHSNTKAELEQYKLLIGNVQDYAIFLLDVNGYITTWNKGAEKIKGYRPDEIIGKHFSTFYTAEDIAAKKPEKELQIAVKFGRVEDEDWRIRKDGSRFWAVVVITALRNEAGELVGFGKVTRDLTERKLHEDQLREANKLLKLQQQELTRLNQSKDEFISLASHQLRTPATTIKQLLGLYVEGFQTGISEKDLNILTKAYQSNERQIHIINNLLKVAQMDAGRVVLNITDFDLVALMQEITHEFRETVRERQQTITIDSEVRSGLVQADKPNLRMALENLVSNASKYTRPGGSIKVRIYNEDNTIKVAITDTGVGIAAHDLKGLFEKFKRLPNDLSDEVGGTGLGLYWANKVLLLHNGSIEVESRPNKGSTFTVQLPLGARHA